MSKLRRSGYFSIRRPDWQLPPGVPPGAWAWAQCPQVAQDYDRHFADDPLFRMDVELVERWASEPGSGWFVDLGCGTGRVALHFARRGWRVLAVDLSLPMLEQLKTKAAQENLSLDLLAANLVQLECLAPGIAQVCVCLFSTLGMIRPRAMRCRVLAHVRRLLRPQGIFVLHVHNRWFNLWDQAGRWWLLRNAIQSLVSSQVEWGDKYYSYQGVPDMFLHVFSLGEIRRDLLRCGLQPEEVVPVPGQGRLGQLPRWIPASLRAAGWILRCVPQ